MFKNRIEFENEKDYSRRRENVLATRQRDRQRAYEFVFDLAEGFGAVGERLFGSWKRDALRGLNEYDKKEVGRHRFFRVVGFIKFSLTPVSPANLASSRT